MEIPEYLRHLHQQISQHLARAKERPTADWANTQPFRVLLNRAGLTAEIYDALTRGLGLLSPRMTEEQIRLRLKYIFLDFLFIGSMSTFEYYAIKNLASHPGHPASDWVQRRGERNVHLSHLITRIPEFNDDRDLWDFAVKLRNDVVHFDAYARQTIPSPITDYPIEMRIGEQAEGVLRSFLSLTERVEASFARFILSLE